MACTNKNKNNVWVQIESIVARVANLLDCANYGSDFMKTSITNNDTWVYGLCSMCCHPVWKQKIWEVHTTKHLYSKCNRKELMWPTSGKFSLVCKKGRGVISHTNNFSNMVSVLTGKENQVRFEFISDQQCTVHTMSVWWKEGANVLLHKFDYYKCIVCTGCPAKAEHSHSITHTHMT